MLEVFGAEKPNIIKGGEEIKIRCQFSWDVDVTRKLINEDGYTNNITLGVALADKKGRYIFGCNGFDKGLGIDCFDNDCGVMEIVCEMPYLADGDYFMSIAIALGNLDHHVQMKWYDCIVSLRFEKTERNTFGVLAIDYKIDFIKLVKS